MQNYFLTSKKTHFSLPALSAEIGCNHKGEIKIARQMIRELIKIPNLQIIKFQKRTISPQTVNNYNQPHPDPKVSYGRTYGEHRIALEFSLDQHRQIQKQIEDADLDYMSSVWDLGAAEDIVSLRPRHIKIPSAKNTEDPLLKYILQTRIPNVHISLGMLTPKKIQSLITKINKINVLKKRIYFYFCVSGYPTPSSQACLLEMWRLKTQLSKISSFFFGFSNHDPGIFLDSMAVFANASYIERHVTLNKDWKGTDHSFSLTPLEMLALSKQMTQLHHALRFRPENNLLPCETPAQKKLK